MKKKGNVQKQHHYIPVTYSKNFTNDDGYIYIKDNWTGKIFPSRPQNSLKQSYLYTQPVHAEGRFDNAIESFFSRSVESYWPQIVDDISNKRTISRERWSELIYFLASMRVRVPNTIKSTIWLLRESAIRSTDHLSEPPPKSLVDIYQRHFQDHQGSVTYRNLIESGVLNLNIDPHRSILSFDKLIRSNDSIINLPNTPTFLHNMTRKNFISSDNPVINHINSKEISDLIPYSFDITMPNELIFPLTKRIALLINPSRKKPRQHEYTFNEDTVAIINRKIALYSDRYIFSENEESLNNYCEFENISPIPNFEKSKVGDGVVYKIGYNFGTPLRIRNNWKYDFEETST